MSAEQERCGVLPSPNAGPLPDYGCNLPSGHAVRHRNRMGHEWVGESASLPPVEQGAQPASVVPDLSALWGLVETLRTQEIERLKNTGVNADYSRSARHANAYLKALSDLEGLLPPRDTEGPKE